MHVNKTGEGTQMCHSILPGPRIACKFDVGNKPQVRLALSVCCAF